MLVLTNPVRDYAWGSRRHLAEFLGRPPSGGPEAELWIGAHEGDPSILPDGRRLDDVIAADPVGMLGERVAAQSGRRLPFLMKILAVNEPLSLQVHPSSERARTGFEREEHAGVPVASARRSYRDPFHKPELIYALTRFEGMAGFRHVGRSAALLRLLGHPWAEDVARRLTTGGPAQALRAVVGELLALDAGEASTLLVELVAAARVAAEREHARERHTHRPRTRAAAVETEQRREPIRVFELFPSLAERYPADPGVLVTLLLNHVVLARGEAMYVGAGVVHAYASGFGLEIMAASDNVLRAGLTPKHRDVAELLAVTDFRPSPSPRWPPTTSQDALVARFEPPVADFTLTVGSACEITPATDGPSLVVALDDRCTIEDSASPARRLGRGETLFCPPRRDSRPRLSGTGTVAVGCVPR